MCGHWKSICPEWNSFLFQYLFDYDLSRPHKDISGSKDFFSLIWKTGKHILPHTPSFLWQHSDGLDLSAQKHIVFFSTAGYSICRVSLWNIRHIYHWQYAPDMQFQKGAFVRDCCSAFLSLACKWIQDDDPLAADAKLLSHKDKYLEKLQLG